MKFLSDLKIARWIVCAALSGIPLCALAAPQTGAMGQPGTPGDSAGDSRMGPMRGPPCGPPQAPGERRGGMRHEYGIEHEEEGHLGAPLLRGLKLTEDQGDRIFAIEHAAAPALRDTGKALRKAREALRELATTSQYDEGHVRALTEAVGKAQSQFLLLRIRTEHDIYGVLLPDQRAELKDRRDRWEARRAGPHDTGQPPWQPPRP